MPLARLAHVLRELNDVSDERLLVGPENLDDAGVVLVGDPSSPVALVQTVDYFPPVVDDPYWYGAVAAANALSDVYAMGGRPVSALTIAGFPRDFDEGWIAEILRGGFAKVREAGAVVAGGHTVESNVQFGFAVTGVVDRERVAANDGAREGDVVYLTKPLGMGCMTTAGMRGRVTAEELLPACEQMATLNGPAAEAMNEVGAHAATDVTGFGLMGHGRNVAKASGLRLVVELDRVPFFPGAVELARAGQTSGAARRGRATLADEVELGSELDEARVALCFDAETSGGLLIFVAEDRGPALERALESRGVKGVRIGRVERGGDVHVSLV